MFNDSSEVSDIIGKVAKHLEKGSVYNEPILKDAGYKCYSEGQQLSDCLERLGECAKVLDMDPNEIKKPFLSGFNKAMMQSDPMMSAIELKRQAKHDSLAEEERITEEFMADVEELNKVYEFDGTLYVADDNNILHKAPNTYAYYVGKTIKETSLIVNNTIKFNAIHYRKVRSVTKEVSTTLIPLLNGNYNVNTGMLETRTEPVFEIVNRNYIPNSNPVKFLKAVNTSMGGDCSQVDAFLRALAYSCTPLNIHRSFFVLSGPGATGKTMFLNILSKITLARPMSSSYLRHEDKFESASLMGKYVATTEEVGLALNSETVKGLSGVPAPIPAQFKYGQLFHFKPIFKVWMTTNKDSGSILKVNDKELWERAYVFNTTKIADELKIPNILATLEDELDAILSYLLDYGFSRSWKLERSESMLVRDNYSRTDDNHVSDFYDKLTAAFPGDSVFVSNQQLLSMYTEHLTSIGKRANDIDLLDLKRKLVSNYACEIKYTNSVVNGKVVQKEKNKTIDGKSFRGIYINTKESK